MLINQPFSQIDGNLDIGNRPGAEKSLGATRRRDIDSLLLDGLVTQQHCPTSARVERLCR